MKEAGKASMTENPINYTPPPPCYKTLKTTKNSKYSHLCPKVKKSLSPRWRGYFLRCRNILEKIHRFAM
jgi:hypothetical protein